MKSTTLLLTVCLGCALAGCKSSAKKDPEPPSNVASGGAGDGTDLTSATAGSDSANPGGSTGTDTNVAPLANCADLGARSCARLEECAPFLLEAYYGDRPTCESLFSRICTSATDAGTPIDLERCATSLSACGSFTESTGVPTWCYKPRGQVALGGACTVDPDCAEGLCQRTKDDAAGTCTTPVLEGQACSPARCALGLRCAPPSNVCVRPLADGAACSSAFQCQAGSTCTADGVCATMQIGDSCSDALLPCSRGDGQMCALEKCVAMTFADEENSCLKGGVECEGTQRCLIQQLANLQRDGQCVATADLGGGCDASIPCIEPLSCRGGSCAL